MDEEQTWHWERGGFAGGRAELSLIASAPDIYFTDAQLIQHLDSNADDSTVNSNSGTVVGATLVAGQLNQALDFNGTTDYVQIRDSKTLRSETNNTFSFAFWLYLDSYDNNVLPRILEKKSDYIAIMGNAANGKYRKLGMEVAASADNGNGNGGISEFWGSTSLQTGVWYHVVATFDGNLVGNEPSVYQGKFYLNGVAETMDTIFAWSGVLEATNGFDLYLARRRTDLLRNLDGKLDEVRYWQRVLSATEALAEYNNQAAGATVMSDNFVKDFGGRPGHSYRADFSVGGTTGSITARFGNRVSSVISAGAGISSLKTTDGGMFSITPTSDFNGVVSDIAIYGLK